MRSDTISEAAAGNNLPPQNLHNRGLSINAAINVSLELSSVCIVEATGKVVKETKVETHPEALVKFFKGFGLALIRIGLEAGPLSQRIYAGLTEAGFETTLMETRHVSPTVRRARAVGREFQPAPDESGLANRRLRTHRAMPHAMVAQISKIRNRAKLSAIAPGLPISC
jgi:transposase